MRDLPKRARPADCLSDFVIDGLIADELEAEEVVAARAHASACERCASQIARAETEQAAFAASAPALPGLAPGAPVARLGERRIPRLAKASAILAFAAALLLFVRWQKTGSVDSGLRTKGHPRLGLVMKHGEAVRIAGPDELASPGDQLRFRYTSAVATYLAILSVDGAGHASIYYPTEAETAHVEAGTDVLLEAAIQLDDAPGTETIYALFCGTPVRLEPIRKGLEARPNEAPANASCVVDRVALRKGSL
jgi:hypothetical protein